MLTDFDDVAESISSVHFLAFDVKLQSTLIKKPIIWQSETHENLSAIIKITIRLFLKTFMHLNTCKEL